MEDFIWKELEWFFGLIGIFLMFIAGSVLTEAWFSKGMGGMTAFSIICFLCLVLSIFTTALLSKKEE